MTGLRSRLQAVDGVEGIELELGDDGLEGITVRLASGADEVAVLEGIRRLLVAYGTKAPREAQAPPPLPAEERSAFIVDEIFGPDTDSDNRAVRAGEQNHETIDLDATPPGQGGGGRQTDLEAGPSRARMVTDQGKVVELSVVPAGERSAAQIHLSWDGRNGRRQVPASSRAIVQAAIDLAAELVGREPISVMGMNVSSISGTRVLTVIAGNHGSAPRVCTASVVEHDWPGALLNLLHQVVGESSDPD